MINSPTTSSTANISATSLKNNVSEGSLSLAAEEFDEEVGDAGPGVVSPGEVVGAGTLNVVDGGQAGLAASFSFAVHRFMKIPAADDRVRIVLLVSGCHESRDSDGDRDTDEEEQCQCQNDAAAGTIVPVESDEDVPCGSIVRAVIVESPDEVDDLSFLFF